MSEKEYPVKERKLIGVVDETECIECQMVISKAAVFEKALNCERCIDILFSNEEEENSIFHEYLSLLMIIIYDGGELEAYNKYKELNYERKRIL